MTSERWIPFARGQAALERCRERELLHGSGLKNIPRTKAHHLRSCSGAPHSAESLVAVDTRPPQVLRDEANPHALHTMCSEDVVDMAFALIDVPSISGFEQAMASCLYHWLTQRGWEVVLQPVAPQQATDGAEVRHNVFAHRPGFSNPELLFNTHIDTVPPFFPASVSRSSKSGGGLLRGRGACDTKGLLAAQLLAAQGLVASGQSNVGLLFVVSEETDHTGMQVANALGLTPRWMIVGEPTEGKVVRAQKGILKLRVSCQGVAAHSGYPHLGHSATADLVGALGALLQEAWPHGDLGETHLNIGKLSGGAAANVVAPSAEADLLFRLISDPEPILERASKIVGEFGATVEVIAKNSPLPMPYVEDVLPGYDYSTVAFNTDIPYFDFNHGAGDPGRAVLYGHGSITDAHTLREHMSIADLRALVARYGTLAQQLLICR